MQIGDRVRITFQKESGVISRIRFDSRNNAIYTVTLDNPDATPSGIYIARDCEIQPESKGGESAIDKAFASGIADIETV